MPESLYKVEIDNINQTIWDNLISQFDDASIYQTWSMGKSSNKNVVSSYIVLKKNDEITACCRLTLKKIPIIGSGVADINWGPMCIKNGFDFNLETYAEIVRAIKKEYGIIRGLLVRIWPHAKGKQKTETINLLESEGFKEYTGARPYRTFIMDISQPLDDIRKNLLQKWRNVLNKAEKSNLEITLGTDDKYFGEFINLAKEMCKRKDIQIGVDLNHYRQVQIELPENLKMQIMLCRENGETISAIICSAVGNTGIYLLGASGQKALKTGASYLLQWNMIVHLKEKGIHYYDLGCFNPIVNPGVYHFKQGLAGKNFTDETFLRQYNGCFSLKAKTAQLATLRQSLKLKIEGLNERINGKKPE